MGQTVLGDLNKLFSASPTGPLCTSDPCERVGADAEDCDAEEEGAFSDEPVLVEVEGADCEGLLCERILVSSPRPLTFCEPGALSKITRRKN